MNGPIAKKSLLLAPGQPNPLHAYPPYSSSRKNAPASLTSWRRTSAKVSEVPIKVTGPEQEKELIDAWVAQMIRMGLGGALPEKEPLPIDLPMDVILTIKEALERRIECPTKRC